MAYTLSGWKTLHVHAVGKRSWPEHLPGITNSKLGASVSGAILHHFKSRIKASTRPYGLCTMFWTLSTHHTLSFVGLGTYSRVVTLPGTQILITACSSPPGL